jgi:hypothetical protein
MSANTDATNTVRLMFELMNDKFQTHFQLSDAGAEFLVNQRKLYEIKAIDDFLLFCFTNARSYHIMKCNMEFDLNVTEPLLKMSWREFMEPSRFSKLFLMRNILSILILSKLITMENLLRTCYAVAKQTPHGIWFYFKEVRVSLCEFHMSDECCSCITFGLN